MKMPTGYAIAESCRAKRLELEQIRDRKQKWRWIRYPEVQCLLDIGVYPKALSSKGNSAMSLAYNNDHQALAYFSAANFSVSLDDVRRS